MTRSILFTATLWLATTCGVAQAEPPSTANVTNAVTATTSSDAEIVQVARRTYRRYSYRPSYRYSRPYYYAPFGYRSSYPYRSGPYYYGNRSYGYYNGVGVRVGPVNVWW
jgi:hypothetical protein